MNTFWDETLFTIHNTPITLVNILTFIGILLLSFAIAKGVKVSVANASLFRGKVKRGTLYGMSRLIYYAILLVGIYVALTIIGIDLTGIAVVVGALSVGIGFGLQTIFNNFVAGIIILVEKKIRPKDMIQLDSGEIGDVLEVNVRNTVIRTLDNRKIVIPNTEIISKKVTNWTLEGKGIFRVRIPFAIGRDVGVEKGESLGLAVAHKVSLHPPKVWLSKVSEKAFEFELVVWLCRSEDPWSSESPSAALIASLERAFMKEGVPLLSASRMPSSSKPVEEI
ncbi:MAG: mechanosensitive ion channel [Chlamydiia bacterium]|nr:mechanosensitive ion channel [Chlamydiia bacterium]